MTLGFGLWTWATRPLYSFIMVPRFYFRGGGRGFSPLPCGNGMRRNRGCIVAAMKRRHRRVLALIFSRPTSGNIPWRDIEALFVELGAEISERRGSRVGVRLFGERRVFHRPHPGPATDKGAVSSIRRWLRENGVEP